MNSPQVLFLLFEDSQLSGPLRGGKRRVCERKLVGSEQGNGRGRSGETERKQGVRILSDSRS